MTGPDNKTSEQRETRAFWTSILLFATLLSAVAFALHLLRFKFWLRQLSGEWYITLVGGIVLFLGIWLGTRWQSKKNVQSPSTSAIPPIPHKQVHDDSAELAELSKRECEVLHLLAEGYSNQQIADQLFISLSTVKSHTSKIYGKLGVRNRTMALKVAREQAILR